MAKVTVVVPTYNAAAIHRPDARQRHRAQRTRTGASDRRRRRIDRRHLGTSSSEYERRRATHQLDVDAAGARRAGRGAQPRHRPRRCRHRVLPLPRPRRLAARHCAHRARGGARTRTPDAPAAHGLADEYSESLGRSRIAGPSEAYGYERFRVSGRSVEPLAHDEPTGFDTLVLWSCISTPGQALVRASELRRVNGFDPSTAWSDDWDLWLRLTAEGPLVFRARVRDEQALPRRQPVVGSDGVAGRLGRWPRGPSQADRRARG